MNACIALCRSIPSPHDEQGYAAAMPVRKDCQMRLLQSRFFRYRYESSSNIPP